MSRKVAYIKIVSVKIRHGQIKVIEILRLDELKQEFRKHKTTTGFS